jgi:NADP-dependent 3-hydroxy acid dehydrogenase YdfG
MSTAIPGDGGAPVLLITGASTGVGKATAELAVDAGYRVALLARSRERLEALAEQLGRERALPIVCDVRSWEEQQGAVAQTLATFGRLDAAFANAGIGSGVGFFEESPELCREMLLVNVHGAALTARACVPALEVSQGHLLFCSSTTARIHLPSVYSATKWAITALGHGLRPQLAAKRVRLTVIEPGLIDTPFHQILGFQLEDLVEQDGIDKALDAEDVARAALYALTQPAHVAINEILLRPTTQIP